MRKLVFAVLAAVSVAAYAQSVASDSTAQLNMPTAFGTVTAFKAGANWTLYVGNGQLPVWQGSQAEFEALTSRLEALARAYRP